MYPRDPIVCRLRIQEEDRERLFTIGDRPIVIGRAPDCDLHLPNESISRQHARIAREDEGWLLRDLGSKNGSRVNTFQVGEQVLRNGDRIDLGEEILRYVLEKRVRKPKTVTLPAE